MKLSIAVQDDLDELVVERRKRKAALDRAQADYDRVGLEIRALLVENGLKHGTTSDGYSAEITEVVNWRDIDEAMVEKDFPKDEYPDLYTPEYQRLKAAVNERMGVKDPESTAAVSKYTGFTEQLRVRKLKQWRTKNRRAR